MNLPCHPWTSMLHEVHGRPQLHLSEVEDARSMQGHTISTSFQCVCECEVECCEHAMAIVASKELAAIREEVIEEAPDPKRSAGSFEPIEGAKEVLIDPSGSRGKVVRIGTTLSSK